MRAGILQQLGPMKGVFPGRTRPPGGKARPSPRAGPPSSPRRAAFSLFRQVSSCHFSEPARARESTSAGAALPRALAPRPPAPAPSPRGHAPVRTETASRLLPRQRSWALAREERIGQPDAGSETHTTQTFHSVTRHLKMPCPSRHLLQHLFDISSSSRSNGQGTALVHPAIAAFSAWPISCHITPAVAAISAVRKTR